MTRLAGPVKSQRPPLAAPGPAALPWLVGDIGGTNARLGWVSDAAQPVQHVRTLPVAEHAGPAQALQAYLAALPPELARLGHQPQHAVLALASTITADDEVALTNAAWRFSRQALCRELGLQGLVLVNDFEALALSLPHLRPDQWRPIGPTAAAATPPQGLLAVVGPGTGLGVAGLMPTRQGWLALPGEGGHATLSAADDFESQLLAQVRRSHPHVSAERLLSGSGLELLHQSMAAVLGQAAAPLTAQQVIEQGVGGSDALCARSLDQFCALLGSFAGNVALTLGARGGVYIGGGIVPRLGERFMASAFRARFEAKGRFGSLLQTIPTRLITDTLAALEGAAAVLRAPPGGR